MPLVLLAVVWALASPPARAQSPTSEQPRIVYQNLHEGDVIQQTAFGIQLCFASPINIKDLDAGGDFAFSVTEPDGFGLGNRDVFQPDGFGVTVYPGSPVGDTGGDWIFHYRVTSPDGQVALEGDINYSIDASGSPFPQATPPACVESGGTATPVAAVVTPDTSSGNSSGSGSGSGSDILNYALIAVGALGVALGAVILFIVGRRRKRPAPAPRPTPAIDWSASRRSQAGPPPSRSEPLTPQPPAPRPTSPPPVAASEASPTPEWRRPPDPVTPPPVIESKPTPPPWSSRLSQATPAPVDQTPTTTPEPTALPVLPTPPVAESPPQVIEDAPSVPEWRRPLGAEAPPPVESTHAPEEPAPPKADTQPERGPAFPDWRPAPVAETPPPVVESTPSPEEPAPQPDVPTRPPHVERTPPFADWRAPGPEVQTPAPVSEPEPRPETPADYVGSQSTREKPANSGIVLLAIAAGAVLLLGLIFGRRGKRGKPHGDDK